MAYNGNLPADTEYLSVTPAELRENYRALKDDKIVNSAMLQDLTAGNLSGQIPISNGTLCTNLNVELLNGHSASYFSPATHTHNEVTTSTDGLMTATDKVKLDTMAAGADVNLPAFSIIKSDTTVLQPQTTADTLSLVSGTNITLTPDATNKKITVNLSGQVPSSVNADLATLATTATLANTLNISGTATTFNWNEQSGQPNLLWGGTDAGTMYVYNPSNFNVNYATTAGSCTGNAATATTASAVAWNNVSSKPSRNIAFAFHDIDDNAVSPLYAISSASILTKISILSPTAPSAGTTVTLYKNDAAAKSVTFTTATYTYAVSPNIVLAENDILYVKIGTVNGLTNLTVQLMVVE